MARRATRRSAAFFFSAGVMRARSFLAAALILALSFLLARLVFLRAATASGLLSMVLGRVDFWVTEVTFFFPDALAILVLQYKGRDLGYSLVGIPGCTPNCTQRCLYIKIRILQTKNSIFRQKFKTIYNIFGA